jgi:hypothetical protein
VELISLILSFATVFLNLIDDVTHPIHLDSLHTFSCEVHHEPSDLCGEILSYDIAIYDLESEVHCAILDRSYLVASLFLFDFAISLLDALCQGAILGLPWVKLLRVGSLHAQSCNQVDQLQIHSNTSIDP